MSAHVFIADTSEKGWTWNLILDLVQLYVLPYRRAAQCQTGCVFVWCMRWRLFSGRLSLCPEGTDVPLWVFRPCKGELKSRINECRYCFNRCLLGHSLRLRATHLSALQTTQRAPGAGALPSYFCPLHLINADDFIPSARPLSRALIAARSCVILSLLTIGACSVTYTLFTCMHPEGCSLKWTQRICFWTVVQHSSTNSPFTG